MIMLKEYPLMHFEYIVCIKQIFKSDHYNYKVTNPYLHMMGSLVAQW